MPINGCARKRSRQVRTAGPEGSRQDLAEVAQRASKLLADHIQKQVQKGMSAPTDELGIAQAFMDMMGKLLANPYRLAPGPDEPRLGLLLLWQHSMMRFTGMPRPAPPVAAPQDDKRFKDEEWQEHFLFDFIKRSLPDHRLHIHDTVSGVDGLTIRPRRRSISTPASTLTPCRRPTLPDQPGSFRETVKSHGQNLIKGLNNLLRDVEEGDGNLRVKMTDTTAFELGRNVATTPGKVVFQTEMMQLLQYTRPPRTSPSARC